MEATLEVQEVVKPLLRSAEEILAPFIKSEKVHSIDPFEVYQRFERAAIFAILEAQKEALIAVEELALEAFKDLKDKLND